MNLLLNTESLNPPLTGIGNYTLNLLQELVALGHIEHIECFSGQHFSSASETLARCQADTEKRPNQDAAPALIQRSRLRALLRRIPFAYRARAMLHDYQLRRSEQQRSNFVYHEPNFILKAHKGPCVATIHDLSFIHYPQHHPVERVSWMTSQLPKTLERADFLITPSEMIRQELIDTMGVPADKVRCTYLGAAECFRPHRPDETRAVLQQHGLEHGRYVLFVASLEPRKGVDILLDAWASLPEELRHTYPLVLAGAPGWKNQELQTHIRNLQATHGLRHLNYVPGEDLPALYAGAAAFVYPSIYEGFGYPCSKPCSVAYRSFVPRALPWTSSAQAARCCASGVTANTCASSSSCCWRTAPCTNASPTQVWSDPRPFPGAVAQRKRWKSIN